MLIVSLFPSNAHTPRYELCIVEIINQFLPDGQEQSLPLFLTLLLSISLIPGTWIGLKMLGMLFLFTVIEHDFYNIQA